MTEPAVAKRDWHTPMPGEEELIQSSIRLVHYTINKMSKVGKVITDYDEAYSAGLLGLLKAARTFDPARAKWTTGACWCIHGEVTHVLRRHRKDEGRLVSIDEPIDGTNHLTIGDTVMDPNADTEDAVLRGSQASDTRRFVDALPDGRLKTVARLTMAGHTQVDIAQRLGISQTGVSRVLRQQLLQRYQSTGGST